MDRLEYRQLAAGFEFPPMAFKIDSETLRDYVTAVGDSTRLYRGAGLVPPLAVAALAMAGLTESISLPPGTIHVSLEVDFKQLMSAEDTLTNRARVSRRVDRGKLHLLNIAFNVTNQSGQAVLSGEAGFALPEVT